MEAEPRLHNAPAGAQATASAPAAGYQPGAAVPPGQQFSNPLDRFWNLYLIDAERADKKLTDGWKGDMDGILIFTGLFATTVGSFIIAVFPSLSPNPSEDTNALLKQIAQQQFSGSNGSQISISIPSDSFKASQSMLRINVLWMLSFFLGLCCALAATLVQQWTRQYLADSQPRGPPSKRGPIHAYLRVGIERFGLAGCADAIVTLLHISVFLFMGGLLEFAFSLHLTVAYSLLGVVIAGAAIYLLLTILPALYSDCPYKTPLTLIVRLINVWYKSSCSFILRVLMRSLRFPTPLVKRLLSAESQDVVYRKLRDLRRNIQEIRTRAQTLKDLPQIVSCQRPSHVFSQMARSLDEDVERHQYLLTLPSYFESLSEMEYPMKSVLEASEWYSPLRQILESYQQRRISGSPPLSPQPLEDLIIFDNFLLTSHHYLPSGSRVVPLDSGIIYSNWGSKIGDSLSSILFGFVISSWRLYSYTLLSEDPAISLLSFCRMLSTDLSCPLGSSILEYDLPLRNFQISLRVRFKPTHDDDRFLLSFDNRPLKMSSLYRLLYFTRAILHYGAAQNELLEAYKHIWVPILHGLHSLTLESNPYLLSDETRLCVYELISVIGRDDILPRSDLGLPPNARRHDYGAVFEAYPVLGGCLRSIISAMGLPSKYQRFRLHHHASALELGPGRHLREGVRSIDHGRLRIVDRFEPLGIPEGRISRASI